MAKVDLDVASPSDAQVQPYRTLLNTLESRCSETRTGIGDMATRAKQLIAQDFDREVSVRHVLEQLRTATTDLPRGACSEQLAPLIVLIGSG